MPLATRLSFARSTKKAAASTDAEDGGAELTSVDRENRVAATRLGLVE